MFSNIVLSTSRRNLNLIILESNSYFNCTNFLKYFPNKCYMDWRIDDKTISSFNYIDKLVGVDKKELELNINYHCCFDGKYINPYLVNNFLRWVSVDEALKYVYPEYLKHIRPML
jgi:hypothetical protein